MLSYILTNFVFILTKGGRHYDTKIPQEFV